MTFLGTWVAHKGACSAVCASGGLCFTAGRDGLSACSLPGLQAALFEVGSSPVTALVFVDGFLVASSRDGRLRVWRADGALCSTLLPPTAGPPGLVALAAAQGTVAATFADGSVRLWAAPLWTPSGQPLRVLGAGTAGTAHMTPGGHQPLLLVGYADGGVRVWPALADAAGRRGLCGMLGAQGGPAVIALSSLPYSLQPSATLVFVALSNGNLSAHTLTCDDLGTFVSALLATWAPPGGSPCRALAAAQAGLKAPLVFGAAEDGSVKVWAPLSDIGGISSLAPKRTDWLTCACVTELASSTLLLVGDAAGCVSNWDVSPILRQSIAPLPPLPRAPDRPATVPPTFRAPGAVPAHDAFPVPLREARQHALEAALRVEDSARAAHLAHGVSNRRDAVVPQQAGWHGGFNMDAEARGRLRLHGPEHFLRETIHSQTWQGGVSHEQAHQRALADAQMGFENWLSRLL